MQLIKNHIKFPCRIEPYIAQERTDSKGNTQIWANVNEDDCEDYTVCDLKVLSPDSSKESVSWLFVKDERFVPLQSSLRSRKHTPPQKEKGHWIYKISLFVWYNSLCYGYENENNAGLKNKIIKQTKSSQYKDAFGNPIDMFEISKWKPYTFEQMKDYFLKFKGFKENENMLQKNNSAIYLDFEAKINCNCIPNFEENREPIVC